MNRFKLIFPFLFAIPLSCTVKEDRSVCLCILDLNCSYCDGVDGTLELVGWDERGKEWFCGSFEEKMSDGHCEFEVPRCDFSVAAYCARGLPGGSRQIVARSGCQADSVYAFAATLDTRRDECPVVVNLSKQFATIRLSFKSDESGMVPEVESVEVYSTSNGFSLPSLEGVRGEFRFSPEKDGQGLYGFRLFRQIDGAATVDVKLYSGDIKSYPLGKILEKCGYDWMDAGLQDADLELDMIRSTVQVVIGGWNRGEVINVSL